LQLARRSDTDALMKTSSYIRPAASALVLAILAAGASACSAGTNANDDSASTSSDLRALLPEEILGELHYGEQVEIAYTSTPRYRAYWFEGTKGDWLDVGVTSSTGAVDAFVVDAAYNTVRRGTRAVLPKNGKYYIAVREDLLQPASITIDFKLTVIPPGQSAPTEN
jgi:hypothetical protein